MKVLVGIICIILAAVFAFKKNTLVALAFILIGTYFISDATNKKLKKSLSKSEYGRQVLAIERNRRHMKERRHMLSSADIMNNTVCPVCDTPVSDNESTCDLCGRHVHNSCVRVCHKCNSTYCMSCMDCNNDFKCVNCGAHVSK